MRYHWCMKFAKCFFSFFKSLNNELAVNQLLYMDFYSNIIHNIQMAKKLIIPSPDEKTKHEYNHAIKCYSVIKIMKILTCAATWIYLEGIMLCERS